MKKWIIYTVIYSFVPMLWSQTDSLAVTSDSIHIKGVVIKLSCPARILVKKYYPIIKAKNIATAFVNRGFFFKQYGSGSLSTIAYRGTDASHTSVYWNDVAINSSLNGQTDFSTLRSTNSDYISLSASTDKMLDGAIGGVVSMNENIAFKDTKSSIMAVSYGSFNTIDTFVRGKYATESWYSSLAYSAIKSANDYKYYKTSLKNDNADYTTQNIAGTLAYKWNKSHIVKMQILHMFTNRNTARTLSSTNNAHLDLGNTVALLNWQYEKKQFSHRLQFAVKKETSNYQYDKDFDLYSKHQATVKTISYKPIFKFENKDELALALANENTQAEGDNIAYSTVNLVKTKVRYKKQLANDNSIIATIQQDFSSQYKVPLVFQLKTDFHLANDFKLEGTLASNYRLPTANDLFWNPGGNPNLEPEHSFNADLHLAYTKNKFNLAINPFYIRTNNLIKWQPTSGAIWSPVNVKETANKGVTIYANYNLYKWRFQFNYTYTKAVDLALMKQLTYVPLHQSRFNLVYNINDKIDLSLNTLYTGSVFITTSNTQQLNAYLLNNLEAQYQFTKEMQLSFMLNNIFNTNYMAYADRPMPLRNFKIQFIYNPNFKQLNKNKNENNY